MPDWTRPQERALLTAAQAGMRYLDIAQHLYRLGYPLRSKTAIQLRLRKVGYSRGWGVHWTAAEDARLTTAYETGESLRTVGRELDRTACMIRHRAGYLGLQGNHPNPVGYRVGPDWTAAEIEMLRACYGKEPTKQIAERLRRTVQAVCIKAQSLGIRHGMHRSWSNNELRAIRIAHAHGLSITDLAEAMERDPSVVSRQAKRRMGLHFDRRTHRAPRSRRDTREPITLAGILALGGGGVDRTRPAWSILAGVPHRIARAA